MADLQGNKVYPKWGAESRSSRGYHSGLDTEISTGGYAANFR